MTRFAMTPSLPTVDTLRTAFREAVLKIGTAARKIARREDEASVWVKRIIYEEVKNRVRTRGPAYWDDLFPGLPPEERAERRIRRMLGRCTVASIAAGAGATTAEVLPLVTKGFAAPAAVPLGFVSVGAEMLYTTALQVDLAFDLASIYGVSFGEDDVGEISTLLASALGVEMVGEPTRHDKPADEGETKPWRVLRQMQRDDFATRVGRALLRQAIARNAVPVAGVVVSVAWNQVVLRRFASAVHTAVRRRWAIVNACRGLALGEGGAARTILDGAWLIATADGDIRHQEALALATLIDSLSFPDRIATQEASFSDDEEEWFERVLDIGPSAQSALIRVLVLVGSADGELSTPERRFLRRLARTLKREIDLTAVDDFVAHLRAGKAAEPLGALDLALGFA
jgi:tellurite resistance protein